MQYLWQWRLYGSPDKRLTDGRALRIIDPGRLNTDSGPDFFNAKLEIDGTLWAGNVELHLKASDWHRHGHQRDRAYDSVILHVVGVNDSAITRTDGSAIPQLHLPFDAEIASRYRMLSESSRPLRCQEWLPELSRLHLADWIDSAAMERLTAKARRVEETLRYTNGDWSQTTFITIARALGFGLNGEPFEQLARCVPVSVAARHSDSLFQLEALLLGQAGLLGDIDRSDTYALSLADEYSFLAHKYSLTPLPAHIWKMSRTRPGNSPCRRIALLARLTADMGSLMSRMLDCKGDVDSLADLFVCRFDGYWSQHYSLSVAAARPAPNALGADMARTLILNTAPPLYYAYGALRGIPEMQEMAQDLLMALPPERNTVTRFWEQTAGICAANALESQGLLQIRRNYCEARECLRCRFGHRAIRQSVK